MARKRRKEDLARILRPARHVPLANLPTDKLWRTSVLQWLQEHELTQLELAEWIDLSQGSLSNMLSEKNRNFQPRHPCVERVAVATGLGLPIAARIELATARIIALGDLQAAESAVFQIEALAEHAERHKA